MSKPTGKLAFAYATIARLEARIAELEADKGQGEPVARVRHSPIRKRLSVELLRSHMKDGDLLYAEQPAPVAVVMPELDDHDRSGQNYWADQAAQGRPYEQQLREACERNGIDPGLDEVARLNGVKS